MNLVYAAALLIVELSLWFYACNGCRNPIERTLNLIYISTGLAVIYGSYVVATRHVIDIIHPFVLANAVLAIILIAASHQALRRPTS